MRRSFASRVGKNENDLVYFISARNKDREAWYYARIDKLKQSLFLHAVEKGAFDIADYGLVLASGYGDEPPADIRLKFEGKPE